MTGRFESARGRYVEPGVPTGGGRRVPFGGSPPSLVTSSGDGVHMGWRVPGASPPAMCIGGPASQNRAAAGPRRQPSQGWDTARCHVRRETGGAWVHQFRGGSARGCASIAGKPPGGGNLMCRSCWAAWPRAHRRRATRRWKSHAPVVRLPPCLPARARSDAGRPGRDVLRIHYKCSRYAYLKYYKDLGTRALGTK